MLTTAVDWASKFKRRLQPTKTSLHSIDMVIKFCDRRKKKREKNLVEMSCNSKLTKKYRELRLKPAEGKLDFSRPGSTPARFIPTAIFTCENKPIFDTNRSVKNIQSDDDHPKLHKIS